MSTSALSRLPRASLARTTTAHTLRAFSILDAGIPPSLPRAAPTQPPVQYSGWRAGAAPSTTSPPTPLSPEDQAAHDAVMLLIGERDARLRASYDSQPASLPPHAQPPSGPPLDGAASFRKRLLYRSRQRGW